MHGGIKLGETSGGKESVFTGVDIGARLEVGRGVVVRSRGHV